jgi:hypothetical protein
MLYDTVKFEFCTWITFVIFEGELYAITANTTIAKTTIDIIKIENFDICRVFISYFVQSVIVSIIISPPIQTPGGRVAQ